MWRFIAEEQACQQKLAMLHAAPVLHLLSDPQRLPTLTACPSLALAALWPTLVKAAPWTIDYNKN
jgi:hypothetical protein